MFDRLAAFLSRRAVALQIGALVAVAALPLLAVSGFMFDRLVAKEREQVRESLMARTKALAVLVDNQIDTYTAIGWILAGSSKLRDGDIDGFREQAAAAIAYVPGSWVVLRDYDGRAVFSTQTGARAPAPGDPGVIHRAAATRKPQLADLDLTSFASPAPYVEIPVRAEGEPRYSIEVVMNPSEFLSLFESSAEEGEFVALLDRQHRFIARMPDQAGTLGRNPSEGWRAALARSPNGWTENRTLEGTDAVSAYTTAADGWTIGIGKPDLAISTPARRLLSAIALASFGVLAMSALVTAAIARRIHKGMGALALTATRVGAGEVVEPPEAPFAEARAIGAALAEASRELERRGHMLAQERSALEETVARRTEELRREIVRKEQVEEQLRQSQKMEALGQLSGGIAHDFNNMLAVIVASLQLVKRRLPPDGRLDRHIEAAMSAADRAAALTRRLLAFSRQQQLEPVIVDVNAVIREIADFVQRTLGPQIEFEMRLAGDVWPVHIDPRQFELAIVNLAVNARDAMEGAAGRVSIETRNVGADRMSTALGAGDANTPSSASVVVSVVDSGVGMDAETMARAAEPFFTTRPVGKGAGLGLSQAHGFVQQSGGRLRILSEPGEGATLELWFPRHEGEGVTATADLKLAAPPRAHPGERVLVVEDVDQVRALVVEALRELGYATLEAGGGDEALALLAAAPPIDLMLTDIVMPGISGRELAQAVKSERPDLRVIYMTGFARGSVLKNRDPAWEGSVLRKPFTFEQLARTVRASLDMAA